MYPYVLSRSIPKDSLKWGFLAVCRYFILWLLRVAREYEIPAVVGVKGATKTIGDGQQVEVFGEEGKVVF